MAKSISLMLTGVQHGAPGVPAIADVDAAYRLAMLLQQIVQSELLHDLAGHFIQHQRAIVITRLHISSRCKRLNDGNAQLAFAVMLLCLALVESTQSQRQAGTDQTATDDGDINLCSVRC